MDMTLPEFLAHAIALEHEAAERYLELADMMESYRNDEVAATVRDMDSGEQAEVPLTSLENHLGRFR